MIDKDKAAEYDRIANYLRKQGWRVVNEWKHPVDGSLHESWNHPNNGENSTHDIMSAYRVECYKDAPGQGERMQANLDDLNVVIDEKNANTFFSGVVSYLGFQEGARISAAMKKACAADAAREIYSEPDNTPEGLAALLRANARYRAKPWPSPFDQTTHKMRLGDARDLSWIPDETVHLIVTSPPYWTLKEYEPSAAQMGAIVDYEKFLGELDKVWKECARVLVPGGRICCVVGDVCIPRKREGRHYVMPLHADIQVRARGVGLDNLTPILWHKIANGVTEAEGNGAGFYGKPYQPGAVVKNDVEYILFLRKGGGYRSVSSTQKALSMLTKEEMQAWFRSFWTDVKGASTRAGHPAPYPVDLADRLIRMFSFAGDVILDPFAGTGSTSLAALAAGRNSIGNEIEPSYLTIAGERLARAAEERRTVGATRATVLSVSE